VIEWYRDGKMALIISTQNILGSFRMPRTCFRIGADSGWDVEMLLVPGLIAKKSLLRTTTVCITYVAILLTGTTLILAYKGLPLQ
jgi:hypothetical protein